MDQVEASLDGVDAVALAVSGGRDSMCMLHALTRLGRRPVVLTVDHDLHSESRAHADFVAQTARGYGLESHIIKVRVGAGEGPEDAARRARLAALVATGLAPILLAHSADDQLETVLMRLADGAGLRGVSGIAPSRGPFLRPWLGVARADIAAYAAKHGVQWREDPSNTDQSLRRNRLRAARPQLGLLEGWAKGLNVSTAHLRSACALQDFLVASWFGDDLRADQDCVWVRRDRLTAAPPEVQSALARAIIETVERALGSLDRRARGCAPKLVALARGKSGGFDLPNGLRAERDPVAITIWRPGVEIVPPVVPVTQVGRYEWGVWDVEVQARPTAAAQWHIRARERGERLARDPSGTRSIARAWAAAGVPRRLRAGLPILADNAGAIWVPGLHCVRDPGTVRLRPGPRADVGARAWWRTVET